MLKEEHAAAVDLPEEVRKYAARMRLWEAIGIASPAVPSTPPSGTMYHELTPLTDLAAVENVAEALVTILAHDQSECDEESKQSLFVTLTELLGNCHHHARTADGLHGLVCAQTWWKGSRAQFAIADSGIGIRRSLAENLDLQKRLAKMNACGMSLELGISSKLGRGHQGYGLTVARDLARLTSDAFLFVQSCDEAVCVQNGKVTEIEKFDYAIPGTLVVFEWDPKKRLDISSVYATWPKGEKDEDEFF